MFRICCLGRMVYFLVAGNHFVLSHGHRGAEKCYNRSLCEEHLNLILPAKPPFHPRQFKTCAVVGNSGDLLKTEFGEEIDGHDVVIRDNEAPVNEVKLQARLVYWLLQHFHLTA